MNQPVQPKMLEGYSKFHAAVLEECQQASTLQELSVKLKSDPALKGLRTFARRELQEAFDQMGSHVGITKVPVYLPVRKKIRTRGQAHTLEDIPQEIRIYAIEGSTKPYALWTPSDISCMSTAEVFECLMHEAAHILEADRHSAMSHDQNFVNAYEAIEQFVEISSYSVIRDKSLRLAGVPNNSIAARIGDVSVPNIPKADVPHQVKPKPSFNSSPQAPSGSGCAGSVLLYIYFLGGVLLLMS